MLEDVSAPSGAALAIRAETFAELGGFTDELFMYQEDVQLSWRAQMYGRRVCRLDGTSTTNTTSVGTTRRSRCWSAIA